MRLGRLARLGVGFFVVLAACGPTDSGGGGGARDAGGVGDGSSSHPGSDASVYTGDGGTTGCPDCVDDDGGTCAAEATRAQLQPLDIYVMQDQSGSMKDAVTGGTKWSAVGAAVDTFLQQPLTGVSVGLQFFPLKGFIPSCGVQNCTTDADCGSNCGTCTQATVDGGTTNVCSGYGSLDSCAAAKYAVPDVEIQPLPGVYSQIQQTWLAHSPNGGTPTSAALQGAIDHAKTWASAHPDHVTIVLLATDGEPTECDANLAHIDAIAATGAGGAPKILTYVIGVGASLSNLDGIAAAGGTTSAFMVDTGGNVAQQMLAALNAIRGQALGCTYQIPSDDGGMADPNKVNVRYTPGGGQPVTLPQVGDHASCPAGTDAWYYDDPTNPTKILLCDSTCNTVKNDTNGEVDVLLGCKTIIID
jgi:hypothetical protein